jgi:HxlR-like helix-turn-helix protein
VSLASEVLGERWTILIIFALCDGSSRFNRLQRALPRISASTLAQDLDPRHLIWSVHLRLNLDAMPSGRTTIQFEFTDLRQIERFYWIVVNKRKVDVCLKHPGHEPDVCVASEILRFIDAWRGFRSLEHDVQSGRIKVTGPPEMRKAFAGWLLLSAVAHKRTGDVYRDIATQTPDPACRSSLSA